ncbi:MAG: hypothetical protein KC442_07985 [Thermomicrobiales bacterium]|nr:hypothetical protein [Thermomicrobiales bacterium]
MAHIFIGNRTMVDAEVLEAVEHLPDDFWVFAEFTMGTRNVDWLVIRPVADDAPPDLHATITVTELKRTNNVLEGGDQGPWRELKDGDWSEIVPSNKADQNYYWQLVNTCNECRDWMFSNHRRFIPAPKTVTVHSFRPWPMLLILSPPGVEHRLPLYPQSRYGSYHFDLGSWLNKLLAWKSREGVKMTASEVGDLARILNLQAHVPSANAANGQVGKLAPGPFGAAESSAAEAPQAFSAPPPVTAVAPERPEPGYRPRPPAELDTSWVAGLTQWVASVEARLARLEEQPVRRTSEPRPARPETPVVQRPLTDEERELVTAALNNLRESGRNRDFPNFFKEVQAIIGEPMRERGYHGFGTARRFLDQAVADGIIVYGPLDNNRVPTLRFPDEVGSLRAAVPTPPEQLPEIPPQ